MENISSDTVKTVASLARKRALELCSIEDDSELRQIFATCGGIETGIKFFTILNGKVEAWIQLFKCIDNNIVHSNIELLKVNSNITNVYFKTCEK